MLNSNTSFGTRQGGLASSYRAKLNSKQQSSVTRSPVEQSQAYQNLQAYAAGTGHSPWGEGLSAVDSIKPAVTMRFVSAAIDFIILFVLTMLTMMCFDLADGGFSAGGPVRILENYALTMTLVVIWFGYGLFFESSAWQGTLGKKLTGLVITDTSGNRIGFVRALGRACGKVLSACVPFYISYIMAGSTKRNQTMHDLIAGTLVFRRKDLLQTNSVFD